VTDVSQTTRSPLQQRVAGAIVDAAARVFAEGGEQASMNEVAEAAGVGRATLYRYFASRQALLAEVVDVAAVRVGERLRAARLDGVAVEEALGRAVRALVEIGDYFVVLSRERTQPLSDQLEPTIVRPLAELFERGRSMGRIRGDIPSSWLTELLIGHVVSSLSARPSLGYDDTVAAVTSLFLDGARDRTGEAH
jgi:TetR/AcrR family transcriptional regulator, mexCD-oprJ operon repressor